MLYNFQKLNNIFIEKNRIYIIFQAVFVGLLSGMLVVLFKLSIDKLFAFINFEVSNIGFIFLPFITALGGLISGILVYKFAPETKGSGIPYVKATLMRLGNLTRIRSIFVKFFGGLASIGCGMSLGREGPGVQLGAGVGALAGKLFKLNGTDKDKLISAGAGSAIAATFNAPIAGAIFVLEELMQKFSSSILFPVIIATVTASSLSRFILGNNTAFKIPYIAENAHFNLVVCIILGVSAGLLGVIFSNLIHFSNEFFSKAKIPNWIKPAFAGFITGCIGIFFPLVMGAGNSSIDFLLNQHIVLGTVICIFVFKLFITPLCFGSGAVGGIFLPMLMLGAYLGYIINSFAAMCGIESSFILMSCIGMAAFLSAVARTPITAMVMVFEMTGEYEFIIPIMLASAVADLTAETLNHKPIYAELIVRQAKNSKEAKILDTTIVKNIMQKNIKTFNQSTILNKMLDEMKHLNITSCPIVDDNNTLKGIITRSSIEDALINLNGKDIAVETIMNPNPTTVKRYTNLYILFFRLHANKTDTAVVINEKGKVRGIVTHDDIQNIL